MKLSQSCPQASVFTTSRVLNQIRVGRSPDSAGWGTSRSKSQCICAACRNRSLCLYVGLWSSEGTYTVHGQVCCMEILPCTFFLLARNQLSPHASQCPHRNTFSQGQPTALTSPHRPALSAIQWDWLREVSKHFHIRGPPPKHTHTIGFYLRDPPWSRDMCCYDLDVVN